MRFRHWLLLLITGTLFHINTLAQDRCGFSHLQEKVKILHPNSTQQFENWLSGKIRQRSNQRTHSTFSIPVVVHVIHNGEPVGVGSNISDAQILSQIKVLNDDYQRLNDDQVNTPAEFQSVAAGVDLEFVLAKQDPEGLPTSGIIRVKGSRSGWTIDNGPEFKSQSYWPAEDYLNIWVVNLTDEFLGFAQFPVTSLPGVDGPFDRLTDGVVCHYQVFGSIDEGPFDLDDQYNKGRTATHEVGHYLGLLHIFGDEGSCSTTDFVGDTPSQDFATLTCPTHPAAACGHNKMFQNYMDYTDDNCMNMFTTGQIARVTTVLQSSPRRNSLTTSPGLLEPVSPALDLEARRVVSPFEMTCGQDIIPKVELRNRGTTTVTSAQIQLTINGTAVETKTVALSLDQLELVTVSFSDVDLPEPGTSNIIFNILQVNGGADADATNNSAALASQVIARSVIPFTEAFNTTPSTWQILNNDNGETWENVQAPRITTNNRAMRIEFYTYENVGTKDLLISNYINIPATTEPVLKFDRAYAQFQTNNDDMLRVLVVTGCSADLSQAVEIFKKQGAALATAPETTGFFTPSGQSQWASESISLAAYAGQNVQIIFEATNGYGNNLYLDNMSVSSGNFYDVAINSVLTPEGPVFCNTTLSPVIQVQNLGSALVDKMDVTLSLSGASSTTQSFQGLALNTGGTAVLTLAPVSFPTESVYAVTITVANPDAPLDETPANNLLTTKWVPSTETHKTPIRVNLDNGIPLTLVSPGANTTWEVVTTNYDNSAVYRAFDNPNDGEQSWAVSPTIDMSGTSVGSLFFDTSYGRRSTGSERLRVMVSEDCGLHYTTTIFDATAAELSNHQSEVAAWEPATPADWTRRYISLNDFAGKDQVRFAFVVDNDHGNNLYIDNIEWFVADDPSPPQINELFTVYSSESNPYDFHITFNLEDKESARLVVYNTVGQVVIDNVLPGTLNQTYTVNLFGQSPGIYLVRLQTGNAVATTKLFVGK